MELMQQSDRNPLVEQIGCLNVLLMGSFKVDYSLWLADTAAPRLILSTR
jgi:hypothetical protein